MTSSVSLESRDSVMSMTSDRLYDDVTDMQGNRRYGRIRAEDIDREINENLEKVRRELMKEEVARYKNNYLPRSSYSPSRSKQSTALRDSPSNSKASPPKHPPLSYRRSKSLEDDEEPAEVKAKPSADKVNERLQEASKKRKELLEKMKKDKPLNEQIAELRARQDPSFWAYKHVGQSRPSTPTSNPHKLLRRETEPPPVINHTPPTQAKRNARQPLKATPSDDSHSSRSIRSPVRASSLPDRSNQLPRLSDPPISSRPNKEALNRHSATIEELELEFLRRFFTEDLAPSGRDKPKSPERTPVSVRNSVNFESTPASRSSPVGPQRVGWSPQARLEGKPLVPERTFIAERQRMNAYPFLQNIQSSSDQHRAEMFDALLVQNAQLQKLLLLQQLNRSNSVPKLNTQSNPEPTKSPVQAPPRLVHRAVSYSPPPPIEPAAKATVITRSATPKTQPQPQLIERGTTVQSLTEPNQNLSLVVHQQNDGLGYGIYQPYTLQPIYINDSRNKSSAFSPSASSNNTADNMRDFPPPNRGNFPQVTGGSQPRINGLTRSASVDRPAGPDTNPGTGRSKQGTRRRNRSSSKGPAKSKAIYLRGGKEAYKNIYD